MFSLIWFQNKMSETRTTKTVTVEKRGGFHDDTFFKVS